MTQYYTVVGTDNMVKLSMVTTDPTYLVGEGERLLPDSPPSPPAYSDTQRPVRGEPVPAGATEIPYTIVTDAAMVAAKEKAARSVDPLDFMERFTDTEQLAVAEATMVNAQVKLWYDKMLAAKKVNFDDTRTQAGMTALVAAGIITAERSVEILPPYVV
jgi:hypothetical protein